MECPGSEGGASGAATAGMVFAVPPCSWLGPGSPWGEGSVPCSRKPAVRRACRPDCSLLCAAWPQEMCSLCVKNGDVDSAGGFNLPFQAEHFIEETLCRKRTSH